MSLKLAMVCPYFCPAASSSLTFCFFVVPLSWVLWQPTCVHISVAAQRALGGAVATVSAALVVPLILLRWYPLQ